MLCGPLPIVHQIMSAMAKYLGKMAFVARDLEKGIRGRSYRCVFGGSGGLVGAEKEEEPGVAAVWLARFYC